MVPRWTWLFVVLVALNAVAFAQKPSDASVEEESDESLEEVGEESVETAESRPLQPQGAEERADDRDRRQLPGQPHVQRLPNLGGASPQGFRASVQERDSESLNRNTLSSTQAPIHVIRQTAAPVQIVYRATPAPQSLQAYRTLSTPSPVLVQRRIPAQQYQARPQGSRPLSDLQEVSEEELEPEKEEPDRLTELLPHSKFSCQNRNTGYYADEGLSCEVFHYCQDGARHSWVCPEGFTFHQVHLICMPPSSENICQKSSNFFFVNDYLYRPINEEEVQRKPNVSLRYSDRYYPQNYYSDPEDAPIPAQHLASQHIPQRVPLQQGLPRRVSVSTSAPIQYQPTPRPVSPSLAPSSGYRHPSSQQVFHSPEEVNIPLQLRRPVATTARNFQPTVASDEYEDDDAPTYRQG